MAVTKAQRKAVSKYETNNYDKVLLRIQKGKRDEIKAHAEKNGESLNAMIKRLLEQETGLEL